MKTKSRGLSKTELPVVRHRLGMTIKDMAQAVGLKLPSYYYYETRYVGEELPAWLADKIIALARRKNVDLSARTLRAPVELRIRNGGHDQARLLRDILRTLHDIRVIMRERRGPSAVFVVKDERRSQGLRGAANGAMRTR